MQISYPLQGVSGGNFLLPEILKRAENMVIYRYNYRFWARINEYCLDIQLTQHTKLYPRHPYILGKGRV